VQDSSRHGLLGEIRLSAAGAIHFICAKLMEELENPRQDNTHCHHITELKGCLYPSDMHGFSSNLLTMQRQVWFIPSADERGLCR